MTNKEKAQMIQGVIDHPGRERTYYSLLEDMGDLKGKAHDSRYLPAHNERTHL